MKILKWILLILFCPVTLPIFLIRKFVELKSMGRKQAMQNIEIIKNDIKKQISRTNYHISAFVVIDFETTGASPVNNRIIEIGAVKIVDGQIAVYSTLVNPRIKIPEKITAITGITNEMIIGMPDIVTAIEGLINFIGELPIVAHNATFHMRFFIANTDKEINNTVIDTLQLCRDNLELKSYMLDLVCKHLGIKGKANHSVLDYCHCTVKLFLELQKRFKIYPGSIKNN